MFRRLLLAVVLLIAVMGTTAPAAHVATPVHAAPAAIHAGHAAAFFDKTRVVVHLAIAYGVFHHWIWKPYKAGNLNLNHKVALIKAGLALLFAVHEIHKALDITKKSNSGTLKHLNGLLVGLEAKFSKVGDLFHKAPADLTDAQIGSSITDLNSGVDASNKVLNAPDAPIGALGNFS